MFCNLVAVLSTYIFVGVLVLAYIAKECVEVLDIKKGCRLNNEKDKFRFENERN